MTERLEQTAPLAACGATVWGLGTATPDRRLDQETIYKEILAPLFHSNRYARAIFRHAGVAQRRLVVEKTYYDRERSTEARNKRYIKEALRLGEAAIGACLQEAGGDVQQVDDFIVVSCTGIDTPGLDLRLAARLGMRPDVHRATILGMGCYGALPGLLRAGEAARAGRRALLLAIELCSLHFQPHDSSTQNVVSAALFADGAAAALVGPEDGRRDSNGDGRRPAAGPRLLDFETMCEYTTFDQMGFHLTDQGFQMRLGANVPQVLAESVQAFVDRLLARSNLQQQDVDVWVIHPGSSKILDKLAARLALAPDALDASRAVLQQYGNMSSPTILFVLDEAQRRGMAAPGAYGVVMAFGPGLTLEGALVQW